MAARKSRVPRTPARARSARRARSQALRRAAARVAALPEAQRYLPAGYHEKGGHVATMAQVTDPKTPTVDGPRLTPEQAKQLTLARIALQRDVRFGTLDGGIVDKGRALREVQEETPLGKALIEIERRTMEMVREYAKRGTLLPASKRPRRRRRRTRAKKATAPRASTRRAGHAGRRKAAVKPRKRR